MNENGHCCILMGSPRKNGNTNALLTPFCEELNQLGVTTSVIWLYDKTIKGCMACRTCQKDWTIFGCPFNDDMQTIFNSVLTANLIILATPIYSWYCTTPMKAVLDRLVYGMNKYYGQEIGPSLWAGKSMALLTTCGYRSEKGTDLFYEGMKRYCKHSKLNYLGAHTERHLGYDTIFMDEEKEMRVRQFARSLIGQ